MEMRRRVSEVVVRIWTLTITMLPAVTGWPAIGLAQDGQTSAVVPPVVASSDLPRDLSPWGMFLNADTLVKAVLIGLAFASVVTWTVWLAKSIELMAAKRRARR